ncbi:magnesium transporter MgtE N-terminal domain-containing protein [Cohnella caldifontis]|uniref:magnesium transporter MgtE N-terminal domain-containing protein n=1 Tax=Cohnella caldifontis TaxID=3027471 RepID=UPI0023EC8660|nr:MgtE protein [Cohnella sp. YIM B05605]
MAGAKTEDSSYSGFERFLFFLTPILFTAVLLGVLLILFNTEWRNKALEIGNKVPVLSAVLPNPKSSAPPQDSDDAITVANARKKVDELQALLADREASLKQATQMTDEQKKQIEDLKAQVDQLSQQKQQAELTEEEYTARIKSLAGVYAKMTPSKAAPILESMTLDETALILGQMADTERTRVLEKMTPQKAADVSMKLKDASNVKDQQIAALQARIKELEAKESANASTLDTSELKNTFSSMKAADAAGLLLQMAKTNQTKALLILGTMDDNARSQVLAAMQNQDSKTTAALVGKLLPASP